MYSQVVQFKKHKKYWKKKIMNKIRILKRKKRSMEVSKYWLLCDTMCHQKVITYDDLKSLEHI